MPQADLVSQLVAHLKGENLLGVPRAWFAAASDLPPQVQPPPGDLPPGDLPPGGDELTALEQQAFSCNACRLAETRCKVVFGVGATRRPPVAFVGEGPGADEDRVGEPFVGKAGELLTAAITKGMGLNRSDVYICNVVKCRPPGNRTPQPDEVAACSPYLIRQLELIQPQVIVTLGSPAQRALTGREEGITKIRGRWLEWRGIKLMPTFHPAYILRNPAAKRPFWDDLQEVMRELALPPVTARGENR